MPGFRALADPNYTILDLTPLSPVCSAGERIEGHLVERGSCTTTRGPVVRPRERGELRRPEVPRAPVRLLVGSAVLREIRVGGHRAGRPGDVPARPRAGGRAPPRRAALACHRARLEGANRLRGARAGGGALSLARIGRSPSFAVCQAIRDVLVDPSSVPGLTRRGTEALQCAVDLFPAIASEATTSRAGGAREGPVVDVRRSSRERRPRRASRRTGPERHLPGQLRDHAARGEHRRRICRAREVAIDADRSRSGFPRRGGSRRAQVRGVRSARPRDGDAPREAGGSCRRQRRPCTTGHRRRGAVAATPPPYSIP
jgi:hypothetical protein